jgi:uncharacterized protein
MSDTQESKAAVIRLYQAYASRDAGQITDALTMDALWVAPPGNATQVAIGDGSGDEAGPPDGSNNLDRDAIVAFMATRFGQIFRDVSNEVRLMIAEGDRVVTEARMRATLPNGRSYVNDYCFIYRVRDGRVAEIREYMDTRGGWAQMFGNEAGTKLI